MDIIKLIFQNIKYAIFLLIVFVIINFLTPITNSITSLLDRLAPPASAEIISSQTIINSITGLGKLVTVTVETSKVDVLVEVNKGRPEFYSAHHRSTGVIEAGINFDQIASDSIFYDSTNDFYTVILPSPTISSCRIEDIEQYGWSVTVFQAPWDSVRRLAQYDSLVRFAQDMKEEGILDQAKEETELRMADFVSAITRKPVDIVFKESSEDADFPDSCNPERPDEWEKTEDGSWVQTG